MIGDFVLELGERVLGALEFGVERVGLGLELLLLGDHELELFGVDVEESAGAVVAVDRAVG